MLVFTWPASSQVTISRKEVSKLKTVMLRDLVLRNDPTFVPNGHRTANVTNIRTPPQKKNNSPRSESPVEATTVVAKGSDAQGRSMNYEFPCVSFNGMNFGSFIPPDVAGAVGFDNIILTENDSFRVMTKSGGNLFQQLHQDGSGLWAGLYNFNLFDPKMIYDPFNQRWIHVILSDSRTGSSSILIAVSNSPDPMGGWSLWAFDTDVEGDQWFDYPSVGFNNKWLVINGVMFPVAGSSPPQESRTFIFGLNDLLYGNTVGTTIVSHTDYSHILFPPILLTLMIPTYGV
jgi:hypothetical protein